MSERTAFGRGNFSPFSQVTAEGGAIHPLEIKLSASPDRREVKKYAMLENNNIPRGAGGIVCMSPTVIPITEQDSFIPVTLL